MDNIWNEYFLLSYLKDSDLEEKYREEGYTHMIINGNEIRWPRHKNFMAERITRLKMVAGTNTVNQGKEDSHEV